MKKIIIAASVLLILLAFVSCNNDNKSLDDEVATTVAEELKPRELVEKVLRDGDREGVDISYDLREVEKGAKPSYTHTLSVTVVFSGYGYSRVLTIDRGRLTYTFYGTMAGSRFTSRAYELRTEEAMAISGTSEGTVDVELSIDAREGASGTSYGVTLTTDEEGKTVAEGTPSVSVTIPDDAVLSVGGTETKIPEEKPEYIPPTQYTITYVSDGETIGTATSAYLIQPSEAPSKAGYTLVGWILNDEETPVTSWNTRLNADVTLTAVWEINDTTKFVDPSSQAETEDGSEEAPYRTLAAALNDPDAEVIYVSAGMIDLESKAPDYFQIERGVRIIGEGKAPVSFDENGRAVEVPVSDEITVMDGTIIVMTSEPVVIENMKLIQSVAPNDPSGKKPLVLANNSDSCDVSLIGCVIEPFANYRGVQALNVKAPVIVVDSSVVNVEASEGNSQRAAVCVLAGTFNEDISAKVSVLNSSLYVESDVTAWESIGIGADNIESIDLSVVNSSVIAEGHGYGIRLLSVGSATKKSIVDIKESYIQGWGAIFATKNRDLEFGSKNALITFDYR